MSEIIDDGFVIARILRNDRNLNDRDLLKLYMLQDCVDETLIDETIDTLKKDICFYRNKIKEIELLAKKIKDTKIKEKILKECEI